MTKHAKTHLLFLGFIILVAGSAVLVMKLPPSFLNHTPAQQGCLTHAQDHKIIIQNNTVTPEHTDAAKCDTLTITNRDKANRLIAFGPHDNHVPYAGVTQRLLSKGQSFTVTLSQTGTFRFHDHLHDEVQGTFTVNG